MNLAYMMAPGRGDADLILAQLAHNLALQGLDCCGTVQINTERDDKGPCDMDVRVLPNGPVMRISQDLGPSSRGCRLDHGVLERAVGLVSTRLSQGADVLIINKFGKHEAEGRGFRPIIADALEQGIPVIVGLNALNLSEFEAFNGGMAVQLPPDCSRLAEWVCAKTTALLA